MLERRDERDLAHRRRVQRCGAECGGPCTAHEMGYPSARQKQLGAIIGRASHDTIQSATLAAVTPAISGRGERSWFDGTARRIGVERYGGNPGRATLR